MKHLRSFTIATFLVALLISCGSNDSTTTASTQTANLYHSGLWTTTLSQEGDLVLTRNFKTTGTEENQTLRTCLSSPTPLVPRDEGFFGETTLDWIYPGGEEILSAYYLEFINGSRATLELTSNGTIYDLSLSKVTNPSVADKTISITREINGLGSAIVDSDNGCSEKYFGGDMTVHTEAEVVEIDNSYTVVFAEKGNNRWNLVIHTGENGEIETGTYDSTNDGISIDFVDAEPFHREFFAPYSSCAYSEITFDTISIDRMAGSFYAYKDCEDEITISGTFDVPLY